MPSITEIAESYNLSSQTIRRIVKEHPELDIKLEPRKRTNLTVNQVSALCSLLDSRYKSDVSVSDVKQNGSATPIVVEAAMQADPDSDASATTVLQQNTYELLQQITDLREELAFTKGQIEGKDELIRILEERNNELESTQMSFPKLLEEGKESARESGREQGVEEGRMNERNRWLSMSRWKRFFGGD